MPSEKDDADWLRDRASKTRSGTRYTYQPDAEANRYDAIADRLTAQAAELAKVREALTPSGETKAAYIGEVKMQTSTVDIFVPWTAIKDLMKLINKRAESSHESKVD